MEDKSMTDTLQQRMFRDMADKAIFRQAQKFAFDYADETPGRPVFPRPPPWPTSTISTNRCPNQPAIPRPSSAGSTNSARRPR
jgi:hypothetical protein